MKRLLFVLSIVAMLMLSGCAAKQAQTGDSSNPAVTTISGSEKQFSEDIAKCVAGTPWAYEGASGAGAYQMTYTIDGKTGYKGKEYCKVTGKAENSALSGSYTLEYYFRWDSTQTKYSDLCYKVTVSGQSQEACVLVDGKQVVPN